MIGRYYLLYIQADRFTKRELYWTGDYLYDRSRSLERCRTSEDRVRAKRFREAREAHDFANAEIARGHRDLLRFRVGLRIVKGAVIGMGEAA